MQRHRVLQFLRVATSERNKNRYLALARFRKHHQVPIHHARNGQVQATQLILPIRITARDISDEVGLELIESLI